MKIQSFINYLGTLILITLGLTFSQIKETPLVEDETSVSNGTNDVRKRDFYFPNLDIRSAFKAISSAAGVDIVLSPNIKGNVTLNLTSKTWQQAVEILCQMFNLHYNIEKEYIYVQTFSDYNATAKEVKLERQIIKIKHTKVKDLEEAIKGLLSERGTVTILENSNTAIIKDLPSKVEEIRGSIEKLDVETFQIHIQAQIIEVNSQDAMEMGVNWGYGDGVPFSGDPPPVDASGAQVVQEFLLGKSSPGAIANPSASLIFGILDGKMKLGIENLLTEGKGEIIAKPQITTLDNTEARIFIGEKRPYNQLDQNLNSTVVFVEAGIELIVTPHLTNDKRIILDLAPQKSDARTDAITRGPIVNSTEAKTTVIVEDGQTVVIGGLTSKNEQKTESGFPILKDIPILGYFFKYTKKEVIKQDLIIFITPHIIQNPGSSTKVASPTGAPTVKMVTPASSGNNVQLGDGYSTSTPAANNPPKEMDDAAIGDFLNEIGN